MQKEVIAGLTTIVTCIGEIHERRTMWTDPTSNCVHFADPATAVEPWCRGIILDQSWFDSAESRNTFMEKYVVVDRFRWDDLMEWQCSDYPTDVHGEGPEDPNFGLGGDPRGEANVSTWLPTVAQALVWYYDNWDKSDLRKDTSHIGGHHMDWVYTEYSVRAGRKVAGYLVVHNGCYKGPGREREGPAQGSRERLCTVHELLVKRGGLRRYDGGGRNVHDVSGKP